MGLEAALGDNQTPRAARRRGALRRRPLAHGDPRRDARAADRARARSRRPLALDDVLRGFPTVPRSHGDGVLAAARRVDGVGRSDATNTCTQPAPPITNYSTPPGPRPCCRATAVCQPKSPRRATVVPRVELRPQRRALCRVVARPRVVGRRFVHLDERCRHARGACRGSPSHFQQPAAVRAAALCVKAAMGSPHRRDERPNPTACGSCRAAKRGEILYY